MNEDPFEYKFDDSLLEGLPKTVFAMVVAEKYIFNISDYSVTDVANYIFPNFPGDEINYIFDCIAKCQNLYPILTKSLGDLWILLPNNGYLPNLSKRFKMYLKKLGASQTLTFSYEELNLLEKEDLNSILNKYNNDMGLRSQDNSSYRYYSYSSYRSNIKYTMALEYGSPEVIREAIKTNDGITNYNLSLPAIKSRDKSFMEIFKSFKSRDSLKYAIKFHQHDFILDIIKDFGITPISLMECIENFNTLAFVFFYKLNVRKEFMSCVEYAIRNKMNRFAFFLEGLSSSIYLPSRESFSLMALKGNNTDLYIEINKDNETIDDIALPTFVTRKDVKGALFAIQKGSNVNYKYTNSKTLLHVASSTPASFDIVESLLKNGAKIELDDELNSPLHNACSSSSFKCANILIEYGAEIRLNKYGVSPLLCAAMVCNDKIIELLLQHGAKPVPNFNGQTPLSFACRKSASCSKMLIDAGNDVNAVIYEKPILHIACEGQSSSVVQLLIESGANIECKNKNGETPLFTAVKNQNHRAAICLVKAGANVDIVDYSETPLIIQAIPLCNTDLIHLLLSKNNNVNVVYKNSTPLSVAFRTKNYYVIKSILEFDPDMTINWNNVCNNISDCIDNISIITPNKDELIDIIYTTTERLVALKCTNLISIFNSAVRKRYTNITHLIFDSGLIELTPDEASRTNDQHIINITNEIIAKRIIENKKKEEKENKEKADDDKSTKESKKKKKLEITASSKDESSKIAQSIVKQSLIDEEKKKLEIEKKRKEKEAKMLEMQAIQNAIQHSTLEALKKYHEAGMNIFNSDMGRPIEYAVKNNNLECVKYLFSIAPDSEKHSNNIIDYAVENNNVDMTKFLLDNGVKIKSILYHRDLNNIDAIKICLEYLNDVNHYNIELNSYIQMVCLEICRPIYNQGIFHIQKEKENEMIISVAINYVLYLIEHGASDVDQETLKNVLTIDNQALTDIIMGLNPPLTGQLLINAIKSNDYKLFDKLLKIGYDTNYVPMYNGHSALCCSLECKDEYFTSMLLVHGVSLIDLNAGITALRMKKYDILDKIITADFQPSNYKTYLNAVISTQYLDSLDILLKHGIRFSSVDESMMMNIVSTNNVELLKKFVDNGMKLPSSFSYQSLPVFASENRCDKMLEYFVENGYSFKTDNQGNNPLCIAIKNIDIKCIKVLTSHGATLEGMAESASDVITDAVKKRQYENVKLLLECGAYWDTRNQMNHQTLLMMAIENDDINIVRLLIENGANADAKDDENNTPLIYAIKKKNYEIMKYLIQEGECDICKNNNAAFELALSLYDMKAIDTLFNGNFDASKIPLIVNRVVKSGRLEFVDYVIKFGGDVNEKFVNEDNTYISALNTAAQNGDLRMVGFLIEHGANIEYSCSLLTPFVTNRHLWKIRDVIAIGIPPDYVSEKRAFLTAVDNGYIELVSEMVRLGFDLNEAEAQVNYLKVAIKNFDNEMIKYLLDRLDMSVVAPKYTPETLVTAIDNGYSDIAINIIESGFDSTQTYSENMETVLHKAVMCNNIDVARALLDNGANPNAMNKLLDTPLSIAIKKGFTDLCFLLSEKGASLNHADKEGNTPLLLAIQKDNHELIKKFIDGGADVNVKNKNADNALLYAVKNANSELTSFLIKRGAKLNITNNDFNTPLILSCQAGDQNVVRILVEGGADVNFMNSDLNTPLLAAVKPRNASIVRFLISKGANINEKNRATMSPIVKAVLCKDDEIVKLLIDNGADTNITYTQYNVTKTLLQIAFDSDNMHIFELIAKSGVNLNLKNANGETMLVSAIKSYKIAQAKILIENGADINLKDRSLSTPLMLAITENLENIVKLIVDRDPYMEACDMSIEYPITYAVARNNETIIKYLIEKNVSLNITSASGTPLIIAARNLNHAIVKLLLDNGADVNFPSLNGKTPLIAALSSKTKYNNAANDVIRFLIERGADVNAISKAKDVPLIIAVSFYCSMLRNKANTSFPNKGCEAEYDKKLEGDLDIINLIISKDPDVNAVNSLDETAIDIALNNGADDLLTTLLQKCNKLNPMTAINIVSKASLDVIKELTPKFDIHCVYNNKSILTAAIYRKDIDVINYILSLGKELLNLEGAVLPVFSAVEANDAKIAEVIISKVDNVNVLDNIKNTPLYYAVKNMNLEIVNYLLMNDADPNFKCESCQPLLNAKDVAMLKLLIAYHADVNAKDINGNTLLANSLPYNKEFVEILVHNGADLNGCDKNGDPYIFKFIDANDLSILKLLVDNGCDVNLCDKKGYTLFIRMAMNCYSSEQELLLRTLAKMGANTRVEDEKGYNVFFILLSRSIKTRLTDDYSEVDSKGRSRVKVALMNDHSKVISYFMDKAIDIEKYTDKLPLIIYAIKHKLQNCFNLFKSNKDLIDQKDPQNGKTALIYLIKKKYRNAFSFRIQDFSSQINEPDSRGVTPLMHAVMENNYDLVLELVQNGADMNAKDNEGATALQRAMSKNYIDIIKYLVNKKAELNNVTTNGSTLLIKLVDNMEKEQINKFLYNGINPNIDVNGTPQIFYILEKGKDSIAKMMISQGCDCNVHNKNNETPFFFACKYNCINVFTYLITQDYTDINIVNTDGYTPIMAAMESDNTVIVKRLLAKDADVSKVNKDGNDLLMLAAANGNLSIVKAILAKNPDFKLVNKQGRNALSIAVTNGNTSVVKALISCGSDVNIVDNKQETPFYTACKRGFTDIAVSLASVVADVNYVCPKTGETPLTEAAYRGRIGCVKALLKVKADPNLANSRHKTPLILAVENGRTATVQKLLKVKGIDISAKDDSGKEAYDYAKTDEMKELVRPGSVVKEGKVDKNAGKKIKYVVATKSKIVNGVRVKEKVKKRKYLTQEEAENEAKKAEEEKMMLKEKRNENKMRKKLLKKFGNLPTEEFEKLLKERIEKEKEEEKIKKNHNGSFLLAAIAKRRRARLAEEEEEDKNEENENDEDIE